jgi:hypothetical protein
VALLLAGFASEVAAQGTAVLPTVFPNMGSVDSVVSKANGPILDVFDGALQIDVTNAKITGGDDRLASPVPWSGILVGSRIVAQVTVPDVIPAIVPPRLPAVSVVVFLAHAGSLSGTVQGVDVAGGTFTLLFTKVHTNGSTEWSGSKADGTPVTGIGDISAGMFATASVVTDASGLTARRVFAYAPPTTRILAFRGKVEKIDGAIWTIGENVVQVNADTKLVGDPKVGDLVDVVEKVQILPPGSMAPTTLPVALSITKVVPPPGGDRFVEFDGVVESLPSTPAGIALGGPMGHWKISGRDVVVNGLTKVDPGITVGTAVHVKGVPLPMAVGTSANATPSVLALEITKR